LYDFKELNKGAHVSSTDLRESTDLDTNKGYTDGASGDCGISSIQHDPVRG